MNSRKVWLTYPSRSLVETPTLWRMCKAFPDVSFDIRQASINESLGIMAVLLSGSPGDISGAIQFLKDAGVTVEPIEKTVVEG